MTNVFDRVRETSTTTGTGDITLAGAATRALAFSDRYDVGDDRITYAIEGQSGGEWEVGIGTYSAANTLRRDEVTASSNGDALVNFAAGTKDVWVDASVVVLRSQGRFVAEARGCALP